MTTTGHEILLHMVLHSARSQCISLEKWDGSEFACFVRQIDNSIYIIDNSIFECYFKPFLCFLDVKKPKNVSPQWLCHGPAGGGLQHTPGPHLLFTLFTFFMLI